MSIKLYQLPKCPFCAKVRDVLYKHQLGFEVINIDKENKPDIVELTGGKVPILIDGQKIITDSEKIIKFLDEKYSRSN